MINRHTRLRFRRRLRSRKKQVADLTETADKQLDRHIFRRWHNLKDARRFMIGWLALVSILIFAMVIQTRALGRYYLAPTPASGGVYTEGMVGTFSNANPIYAANMVDSAVSRLVFAGLLTYNEQNQLTGDLAASWDVDTAAKVYDVRLKPNLTWHDGAPLTADDVVFTFNTIKNPDAKSPLQQSWSNIKIEKVSNTAVRFTLPSAFSPFPHSLTTGILPQHVLKDIPPAQLRSAAFNNKEPVGSGPFKWQTLTLAGDTNQNQQQRVQLVRFDGFHGSAAKLDGFTIYTYPDNKALRQALDNQKVVGAVGLPFNEATPSETQELTSFTQTASTMIFLKNSHPILSDAKVRSALVAATNVPEIITKLGYPALPVDAPLLKSHIGYNAQYRQHGFNQQKAKQLLDEAGWKYDEAEKVRVKDGQQLMLNLVSESNSEYTQLIEQLQKQWAEIGVKLTVSLQAADTIAQSYILAHNYDVLLYGINLGPDPDVYPYWHSSQADVRSAGKLNLSEYKSRTADIALEGGRTRVVAEIRALKYRPFLEVWKNDAPAIGLYQPNLFLVTNQQVFGAKDKTINVAADRYNNAQNWMINTERAIKQ